MTDLEFVERLKYISDKSDLDKETKKEYGLLICAACDSVKHQNLIEAYMQKDGITFESLSDYVLSIMPPVEIVDDDEE